MMTQYDYAELAKKPITELTGEEYLYFTQPHVCMTCGWMQPNKEPPKQGQNFCRYDGPIETVNNQCRMWKPQPDPTKRFAGSWVSDV